MVKKSQYRQKGKKLLKTAKKSQNWSIIVKKKRSRQSKTGKNGQYGKKNCQKRSTMVNNGQHESTAVMTVKNCQKRSKNGQ